MVTALPGLLATFTVGLPNWYFPAPCKLGLAGVLYVQSPHWLFVMIYWSKLPNFCVQTPPRQTRGRE